MTSRIIVTEVFDGLQSLPDASVRCCVTSPPYWGLRDYGVTGQIGLESSPVEYVQRMVEVFREVRRVLADDGTVWLNLGDCYATGAGRVGDHPGVGEQGARWRGDVDRARDDKRGYRGDRLANGRGDRPAVLRKKTAGPAKGPMTQPNRMPIHGLKPKDLIGLPWRVAFALQADGWWLRSDIIWAKPNPMPESVTDRPTKSHEYLFLLSKSARYYYDAAAIAEPSAGTEGRFPVGWASGPGSHDTIAHNTPEKGVRPNRSGNKARKPASARGVPVDTNGESNGAVAGSVPWEGVTRNKRTVWTVATKPFAEAHFATFPPELITPCVLAGSALGDTVLDPFAGAGTTGLVANRAGRSFVGLELNPEYAEIARRRLVADSPLFHNLTVEIPA